VKRQPDPCPACGTWRCNRCKWVRAEASRLVPQVCAKCRTDGAPTTDGHFEPIHHWNPAKAADHMDVFLRWETNGGTRKSVVRP
jgi:hypothetical protein